MKIFRVSEKNLNLKNDYYLNTTLPYSIGIGPLGAAQTCKLRRIRKYRVPRQPSMRIKGSTINFMWYKRQMYMAVIHYNNITLCGYHNIPNPKPDSRRNYDNIFIIHAPSACNIYFDILTRYLAYPSWLAIYIQRVL